MQCRLYPAMQLDFMDVGLTRFPCTYSSGSRGPARITKCTIFVATVDGDTSHFELHQD